MWLLVLLFLAVVFIVMGTARFQLHPFLALLFASIGYGTLCGRMSLAEVADSINKGFGNTVGYIGIVIVAGTIIGTFLEKSGGAGRIAEKTLAITGKRNVPLAMSIVGYVVSIPVFCDSGFVILSPLCRSLTRRAGLSLAASATALSLGLYATHTMVPPTPGPVAAAGILHADLGLVILYGGVVSAIAMFAGWIFALVMGSRIRIEPREKGAESTAESSQQDSSPGVTSSLLPILVPIVLIVLRSVAEFPSHPLGKGSLVSLIGFVGQPTMALLIGVVIAFRLPHKLRKQMLSTEGWVGEAVLASATIIIITGAGGVFGKVLQNSGIVDVIKKDFVGTNLGIWLPFLIAASLKTAQGSSTVAIVTTAGIAAPLLSPLGLESETAKALAVVAIGAGSMVVSHANDSFFWVVTQFSDMSVEQGYRLQTLGTLVEGLTAAVGVWALSFFLVS